MLFGTFAASISMQSGAPTFGTPEPSLVSYGAAQLARRLGLPFRTGGSLCGSKVSDAQAAYESGQHAATRRMLAGTNFVLHAAGWLEGGLVVLREVHDRCQDQLGMMQKMAEGIDLSENAQALDAIRAGRPGCHYLGCAHTQAQLPDRLLPFAASPTTIPSSSGRRKAAGSGPARQPALWKSWLEGVRGPAIDPAITEAVDDYIRRRKDSMPDAVPWNPAFT